MNNHTFKDDDEFQRKPFAESLIKLIKSDVPLFPIAINGRWGTGKTTFILKTINLIKKEHNTTLEPIYFDAFLEDFYNDPITSIFTKIHSHLNVKDHDSFFNVSSAISLACGAFGTLADFFYPSLGKVPETINEIAQKAIKDKIEQKSKLDNQIIELDKIIKSSIGNKKLVLFIDELDRCRPDYSLHLLEAIKHIFSIDSLKIVFTLNQSQLIDIIKVNYGQDKNLAQKYLDKFFQLPESFFDEENKLQSNSGIYIKSELKKYNLPQKSDLFRNPGTIEINCLLEELSSLYNLSLRDINKFIRILLVYSLFSENQESLPHNKKPVGVKLITIFGILQYAINGKLYENYRLSRVPFRDFTDMPRYKNADHYYYYILFSSFYDNTDEGLADVFNNSLYIYNLEIQANNLLVSCNIGGIVGNIHYTRMRNTYATGSINVNMGNVGGLVGFLSGYPGIVESSYSLVNITGSATSIGGISGSSEASGATFISNVLSLGSLYTSATTDSIDRIGFANNKNNLYAWNKMTVNGFTNAPTNTEILKTTQQLLSSDFYQYDIGFDNSWDLSGLSKGILPKLYSTTGELLPNQPDIYLEENLHSGHLYSSMR